MKIWIIGSGEPLPIDGEGVRLRRMGNLAEYALAHGHEVEWFSSSFEHYTKSQRCNKDKDITVKSRYIIHLIHGIGYKKNISLRRILHQKLHYIKLKNRLKRYEKPNIIIVPLAGLTTSTVVAKYAKKNNVVLVVDVRDLWPEIYYDVVPSYYHSILKLYVNYCKAVLYKSMKDAYSIVGLSEGFLQYGLCYAQREKRYTDTVIPIAYPNYNYDLYRPLFEKYWTNHNLKSSDYIIVFIGNFGDQFNFQPIIEASSLLYEYKDIKFVLCGTGKYLDKIKMQVQDNVVFPGWIEKEKIASLLANSKLGLIPYIDSMNYRLNTPNKFGEYLSAGLPMLVGISGIMEDLIEMNKCGRRYTNGQSLADNILEYYYNPYLRNIQAKNARMLFENRFSADKVNPQFLNHLTFIYNEYYKRERYEGQKF